MRGSISRAMPNCHCHLPTRNWNGRWKRVKVKACEWERPKMRFPELAGVSSEQRATSNGSHTLLTERVKNLSFFLGLCLADGDMARRASTAHQEKFWGEILTLIKENGCYRLLFEDFVNKYFLFLLLYYIVFSLFREHDFLSVHREYDLLFNI